MGPYAGVDYYLTLCPLQSPLQHIYHRQEQPYARVDLKPMPESNLALFQSRFYPPVRDFGFDLRSPKLQEPLEGGWGSPKRIQKIFSQYFAGFFIKQKRADQ
jgi:hypothetical protein